MLLWGEHTTVLISRISWWNCATCHWPLAGPENDTWQSKQTKEAKKMPKNVAIYSLVDPKIKSVSDKLHVARWLLATSPIGSWQLKSNSNSVSNWIELNWIVRRVACHPARPVSPHGVATGLKQSHQSACTGDCCHIVHTRICVSTSLISGRARRSSTRIRIRITITIWQLSQRCMTWSGTGTVGARAGAGHVGTWEMCQCIWTRVVWLFGQLIGPCSRNNFVANLLTVASVACQLVNLFYRCIY